MAKEAFRIFDAVKLYDALQDYSDMKPVVQQPSISFEQLAGELLGAAGAGDESEASASEQVGDPDVKSETGSATDREAVRKAVAEQFQAKLHRKRGALEDEAEAVQRRTGRPPDELLQYVREGGSGAVLSLLRDDPGLPDVKAHRDDKRLISEHEDEIIETRSGYGEGNRKPESYLESFGDWIENNTNDTTALRVVTQRPRDLTREDLKELKLKLDRAGYTEIQLRRAWSEARNRDIAAGVIGFIRTKALGSPLVPYDERVDRALNRLLQGDHDWTWVQERWLKRIAKQIKENTVVDREALDEQPFRSQGGYRRLDNVFDGQLDDVLGEMHEEIWTDRQAA